MKRIALYWIALFFIPYFSLAQNVGIGTTTPNPKAILDVKASDKGILFPMLTSAQRNAIVNPPDGLHIFNKDEKCLNFYDSVFQSWNCYCVMDTCRVVTISINADACSIDFNSAYLVNYPNVKKFVVLISPGVTISSCGGAAFSFANVAPNISVKIINRGTIYGSGGAGGNGATGQSGGPCNLIAANGGNGGDAFLTKAGIPVTIVNYGLIRSGGGGGGGGGRTVLGQFGGGGGGGAGNAAAGGGTGGGNTFSLCIPGLGCSCGTTTVLAQNGVVGQLATGGTGGAGNSGGGNGGNGGGPAQVGQNGTGAGAGTGGQAGKAISGGSGNSITNLSGGQSFGVVDL